MGRRHREDGATRATLLDILDTPVSPELLPAEADGSIAQRTEDLVGPYELHDFFLYYFLRAGYGPAKLCYLAERAFAGSHDAAAVRKWLGGLHPPLLLAAVQALGHARRSESWHHLPLAARRLAHAFGRYGKPVVAGNRSSDSGKIK